MVGSSVGKDVGFFVGTVDGLDVGEMVGSSVGKDVGFFVGAVVGFDVPQGSHKEHFAHVHFDDQGKELPSHQLLQSGAFVGAFVVDFVGVFDGKLVGVSVGVR